MESQEFSYISDFIRTFRASRGLSLDDLSGASGVSRSMICQIEGNKTVPTISVLSKLAKAMKVPLSELVDPLDKPKVYHLANASNCKGAKSPDGSYQCSLLTEGSRNKNVECYSFEFSKKGKHVSKGHGPLSTEYILLEKGEMKVKISGEVISLKSGDVLEFRASEDHIYIQENSNYAKGVNFIYYAG